MQTIVIPGARRIAGFPGPALAAAGFAVLTSTSDATDAGVGAADQIVVLGVA